MGIRVQKLKQNEPDPKDDDTSAVSKRTETPRVNNVQVVMTGSFRVGPTLRSFCCYAWSTYSLESRPNFHW